MGLRRLTKSEAHACKAMAVSRLAEGEGASATTGAITRYLVNMCGWQANPARRRAGELVAATCRERAQEAPG